MSYEKLLTDRADIFHIVSTKESQSYGVPGQNVFTYADTPDIANIKCLFVGRSSAPDRNEPNPTLPADYLVHFTINSDVRLNDKILWDGIDYKLGKPRKVRNHHIEVKAYRTNEHLS